MTAFALISLCGGIAAASTGIGWLAARLLASGPRADRVSEPIDARLKAIEEHVEWLATDRMIGACAEMARAPKGVRLVEPAEPAKPDMSDVN
ncbi:MAG: hypothetical protein AAFP13_12990 [Pseudomonadota bacterium]